MVSLHIAIYRPMGQDDIPHWALLILDDNDEWTVHQALFGTISPGLTGFRYNTRSINPVKSRALVKYPRLGDIEADIWQEIPDFFASLPMGDHEDWNCQDWALEAITALLENGWLKEEGDVLERFEDLCHKTWAQYPDDMNAGSESSHSTPLLWASSSAPYRPPFRTPSLPPSEDTT